MDLLRRPESLEVTTISFTETSVRQETDNKGAEGSGRNGERERQREGVREGRKSS